MMIESIPETNPLRVNVRTSSEERSLKPGDMLSHFEIISKIGAGGMGVIYLARDMQTDRKVALKLILNDQQASVSQKQRFLQEIKALARLQHPNIVQFISFDDTPVEYYAMEYIEGETIDSLIGKNDWSQIAKIFEQIFMAVAEIHKREIVHRDLKPSNVMIDRYHQPKIMDFGLAKMTTNSAYVTRSGNIVGSLAYMSPEQAAGIEVTGRSDVYSLGATLYHILTGRPPFQGENIFAQVNNTEPVEPRTLNSEIPVELEAICLKCMEKSPRYRYASAEDAATDLGNFNKNLPIKAKPSSTMIRVRKFFMRNKLACSVVSGLVLFILCLISWHIYSLYHEQEIAIAAKNQEEEAKQKAQHQATEAKLLLAKISLAQGKRFAKKGLWRDCGALSANSLTFLQGLTGKKIEKARQEGTKWLQRSSHNYRRLWTAGDIHRGLSKVIYSPDGKTLYGIDHDRHLVSVYNSETGEHIEDTMPHTTHINSIAFSRDGKWFVAADALGNISVRNNEEGSIKKWKAHKQQIHTLSFHPQSKILSSISSSGNVKLWNVEQQKLVKSWGGHSEKTFCVAFHPQGKLLATVSKTEIKIWDWRNQKLIVGDSSLEFYRGACVIFSPDGKLMAAIADGSLHVWDISQQKLNLCFKDRFRYRRHGKTHTYQSRRLGCFSEDSKMIISAHQMQPHAFDAYTGKKLYTFEDTCKSIKSVALAPNGKEVVFSTYYVNKWRLKENGPKTDILPHKSIIERFIFSADEKVLASIGFLGRAILWDVKTGKKLVCFEKCNSEFPAYFLDNDTFVFMPKEKNLEKEKCVIRHWSISKKEFVKEEWLDFNGYFPRDIVVDGNKIAFSFVIYEKRNQRVGFCVYDRHTKTYEEYPVLDRSSYLAMKKNRVAVGYFRKDDIQVWDTKAKKITHTFKHSTGVKHILFDNSAQRLISANANGEIKVWGIPESKLLYTIDKKFQDIHSLSLLDGNLVVSAGEVFVWNLVKNREVYTIDRYHYERATLGGRYLATQKDRRLIELWDTSLDKRKHYQEKVHNFFVMPDDDALVIPPVKYGTHLYDLKKQAFVRKVTDRSIHYGAIPTSSKFYMFDGGDIVSYEIGTSKKTDIAKHIRATTFSFSQYGNFFAYIGSDSNRIVVWDLEKQQFKDIEYTDNLKDVVLSASGNMVAAKTMTNKIVVWDMSTQEKLFVIHDQFWKHNGQANFSNDGSILAYKSMDNKIHVWNTIIQKRLCVIDRDVSYTVIHPSNQFLVLPNDGRIEVWNIQTAKMVYEMLNSEKRTTRLTFNKNGDKLFFTYEGKLAMMGFSSHVLGEMANMSIRRDISEEEIQKWLRNNPQELSKKLFNYEVSDTLELQTYTSKKIW
ncbi:protein kinase domain-containing protein [Candidatus Uabimicrobium amorphum]|uniref:non-specific serine/threonine protein kinase n=1 Tax=Uabimicrobium amorphum TaxID=2596890 RepID=A0A5S9ISB0_UABAM|nr:protein kinase [Candidatus Uabimicrobium amorphum]BBM87233.1 protein kinase [Candidatus Uabimicrobium amorphum]